MEEAIGTQVGDSWDRMELGDRISIMKDLVSIEEKLLSLCFTWCVLAEDCAGLLGITNN